MNGREWVIIGTGENGITGRSVTFVIGSYLTWSRKKLRVRSDTETVGNGNNNSNKIELKTGMEICGRLS